jgi:porin
MGSVGMWGGDATVADRGGGAANGPWKAALARAASILAMAAALAAASGVSADEPGAEPTGAPAGGVKGTLNKVLERLDELSSAPVTPERQVGPEMVVSGNPAATNKSPGVGLLGRLLRLDSFGIRLGGVWIGEINRVLDGGLDDDTWVGQNLLVADATIDLEQLVGWPGALVGAELLTHGGTAASSLTGDVQGFDGLDGGPPLDRTELYELWFRQAFLQGRIVFRLGKQVPTFDFAVVGDVTPLILTPVFSMPTMLGRLPGYPDSATGVSLFVYPTPNLYAGFGFYDGRLGAERIPTGNRSLDFNGDYFLIGEAGATWALEEGTLPGGVGVGGWGQTGELKRFDGGTQSGMADAYVIFKQRLWRERDQPASGIGMYLSFGFANPDVQIARTYLGSGLAWTGAIPTRDRDAFGVGFAWSALSRAARDNRPPPPPLPPGQIGSHEFIVQATYQLVVTQNLFLQPVLSWIPDPGKSTGIPSALALTLRMGILF